MSGRSKNQCSTWRPEKSATQGSSRPIAGATGRRPRGRRDREKTFPDVVDRVHAIRAAAVDPTHVFTLSQVYEGLLLKMGEKGNDGGQFFTPREVIRAVVRVVDPRIGESVYDPGCGPEASWP